ncbi:hypothetical protein TYRP_016754 [Tyrophagus putrescentiae]|nr:hypothetical protein TYRP_016754 [Tyrophagus putrescentiae]
MTFGLQNHHHHPCCQRYYRWDSVVLKLFAIYLKQSMYPITQSQTMTTNLAYLTWMISCVVLSNIYSSVFYSMLTVPEFDRPIDTQADLARIASSNSGYQILMKAHSGFQQHFQFASASNDAPTLDRLIGLHINQTKAKMIRTQFELVKTAEERERVVVLGGKLLLSSNRFLFARRPLHIGSEGLGMTYLAVPLAKGSPLLGPFNTIIVRLREMGILLNWLHRTMLVVGAEVGSSRINGGIHTLEGNPTSSGNNQKGKEHLHRSFSVADLQSVFVTWAIGCTGSTLIFAVELLWSKLKLNSQKNECCSRVSLQLLLSENYRNPMPRFIGDEPLSAYLFRFCNSAAKDGGRTELILVERLQTLSPQFNNSQKSISSYEKADTLRHQINCHFVHYADVSLANLATELATNRHFRFKKLQLIFNLRSLRFDNFDLFNETLVALSQLYYHCPDCLPFVATFDLPDWKLHRWAATSLHYVTDYFQAVLLPRTSKGYKGLPKGVVHLNPISTVAIYNQGDLYLFANTAAMDLPPSLHAVSPVQLIPVTPYVRSLSSVNSDSSFPYSALPLSTVAR